MQPIDVNLDLNAGARREEDAIASQMPRAGEGGAKKSRNRRKKKKSHSDLLSATSKAEANWDVPVQDNSGSGDVGEIGTNEWECLYRDQSALRPNFVQDCAVATTLINDPSTDSIHVSNEEGWEVAGSRRSRRNEIPPRNQYGMPHQGTGWARRGYVADKPGSTSHPAHWWDGDGAGPQPSRGSDVAFDRSVRRDGTVGGRPKVKLPAPQNGGEEKREKEQSSDGRIKCMESLDNGLSHTGTWEGHQNGLRSPGNCEETSPIVKSPDAIRAWNNQGMLSPCIGAWQQKLTIGDFKPSLGNKAWGKNTEEPDIPAKFLPSVKCAPLGVSSQGVGTASCEQNSKYKLFPSYKSVISDDLPSSLHSESICSEDDLDDDSDWVDNEDCDSDASKGNHETWKKDKRLRQFFDTMAALNEDQLNEHDRQWHCPACQGGIGAIDWYRGLQPLLAHANSVRSKRVKLHRNFAKVLEEEIRRRGSSWGQYEEMFGRWKGLSEGRENVNPFIVWPPAVIIQNTRLELDEQDKWIGMGNQELLDLFQQFNVVKARHAYGPQGHRGMGIVVFAESPSGYYDALRLEKHFEDLRRGRENWDHPGKVLFYEGGKRILYGYIAAAEDMEIFNKHSGKSKLKWGLKRLKEAAIEPRRQMDETNQQLNWLKQKEQKQKQENKALEKTVSMVMRKLKLGDEEIRVIRERALEQHEENQKEMDEVEHVYKSKIQQLVNYRTKREEELQQKEENFKQEQIRLVQELENIHAEIPQKSKIGNNEQKVTEQEIARKSELIETSLKDSKEYEVVKREILAKHSAKKVEFMQQQYGQMLKFEKELDMEMLELMEKYFHQKQSGESGAQLYY